MLTGAISSSSSLVFQFPDISRLWGRTKMVYNHTVYVGERLKSHYDTYKSVYKNLCRFFSKLHQGRDPTELSDLEKILHERDRHASATSRIFLEDKDFDAIEDQLQMTNSLREMHNVLMSDVMRILARDHSRFLEQPVHERRFNKVLRCVHDSKLAIESVYADTRLSSTSADSLPPHEKIWYIYCLVERETLSISNLLESVESWERNVLHNSQQQNHINNLDQAHINQVFTKRQMRPKRLCQTKAHKPAAAATKDAISIDNWPKSLRSYGGVGSDPHMRHKVDWGAMSEKHMRSCVLDPIPCDDPHESINDTLRVHKWNLREPANCARIYRPLCNHNRASLLRTKKAVSKPHGLLRPYHAKISTASEALDYPGSMVSTTRVDPSSGRIVSTTDRGDDTAVIGINKKLVQLQDRVEQLIEERQHLEDRIINPIRLQMEHGLGWLKSVHSKKYDDIERVQNDINRLKSEKSIFTRSNYF